VIVLTVRRYLTMKKHLIYALAGLAVFSSSFAAAYGYSAYAADRLRKGAVFCFNRAAMHEAVQAGDDLEWLGAVRGCVRTNHTLAVKTISCGLSSCEVRYFDLVSGTGHVKRSDLYKG
jgi:hypothetical protein